MSRRTIRPVTQVPLTNVSIVRMKRAGKRFEVACYKNKILNWRNGVEKDIDEVLQIDRIFKDVIRGIYASKKDLMKAFSTEDTNEISRIILKKDIATIVAQKCINPETNRHYPVKVIERAIRQHHFNVQSNSSAKKQALKCIDFLKGKIPLERAKMRVRIAVDPSALKKKDVIEEFKQCLLKFGALTIKNEEEKDDEDEDAMYFAFDPSKYRQVQKLTKDHFDVDVQILHSATTVVIEDEKEVPPKLPTPPKLTSSVSDMIPKQNTSNNSTKAAAAAKKKTRSCRTCGGSFEDVSAFRAHYKTDWHRYNQKAKQKEMKMLTEEEFKAIPKSEVEVFFAA